MAGPPKKRPRSSASPAASGGGGPRSGSAKKEKLLGAHKAAAASLLSAADDLESAPPLSLPSRLLAAISSVAELKSSHRSLCLESDSREGEAASARERVERAVLQLRNLEYEREHLLRRIAECREYRTEDLVRMAREETGGIGADVSKSKEEGEEGHASGEEGGGDGDSEQDALVDALFWAAGGEHPPSSEGSYRDPSRHPTNISLLHAELDLRGKLQAELLSEKKRLVELRRAAQDKRRFLDDVPGKIAEMERASLGLQSFFAKETAKQAEKAKNKAQDGATAAAKDGGIILEKEGSGLPLADRESRIKASHKLSGPLYCLYAQVAGYLDAFGKDGADVDVDVGSGAGVRNVETELSAARRLAATDGGAVVLRLPIPPPSGVASGSSAALSLGGRSVQIRFQFIPRLRIVTVSLDPNGGAERDLHDVGTLLEEVFPGDKGEAYPAVARFAALEEEEDGTFNEETMLDADADTKQDEEDDDDDEEIVGHFDPMASAYDATSDRVEGAGDDGTKDEEPSIDDVSGALNHLEGKPYAWANHIAGLRYAPAAPPSQNTVEGEEDAGAAPPPPEPLEPSTAAVLRRLRSRIASRRTLRHLLSSFERRKPHPIPVHPAVAANLSSSAAGSARLAGWSEISGDAGAEVCGGDNKRYLILVKRKGQTLRAKVTVPPTYPETWPTWDLLGTTNTDDAPLYDSDLGRIEAGVNGPRGAPSGALAAAHCLLLTAASTDDGVTSSDARDWVLAHQLRDIVAGYDAVCEASGRTNREVGEEKIDEFDSLN